MTVTIIWAGPWICAAMLVVMQFGARQLALVGIHLPLSAGPLLLMVMGVTWFGRIVHRYRGTFEDSEIGSLLTDLEVSQMRPRAVRLRGEIIGRGVPGAFWSPDLVLRDATGMLFVL